MILLQYSNTRFISWVIKMIVAPLPFASSIISMMFSMFFRSCPVVGSSRIMTSVSRISMVATLSLLFCPMLSR